MRKVILGLVAGSALALGSTAANATTFIGATAGCFGASCAPAAGTATVGGLTWNTGSFNQSDSNGFLAIGSATENLGTFALLDGGAMTYNSPFSLLVNFSAPPGVSPTSAVYSALVTGSVTSSNTGGVFVDFDNTPQNFSFTGGTFTFFVNDLGVNAGGVATQITGVIRTTAIPEPATWGMMLLGFLGIGMTMRRRRQMRFAQLA